MEEINRCFLHLNIRSMRANFDRFIAELNVFEKLPEVIILTEIWIGNDEAMFYSIPSYNLIMCANEGYRAGGVAVFVNHSISVTHSEQLNFVSADILRLHIHLFNHDYVLFAAYRLHSRSVKFFVNEFREYLTVNIKTLKWAIIMGDMNIDLLKSDDNDVDDYKLMMASLGFEALVTQPTRVTETTISCIDHVYLRMSCSDRREGRCVVEAVGAVEEADVTDHHMTSLCLRAAGRPNAAEPVVISRTVINYDKLDGLLSNVDWSDVYKEDNVSVAFDVFEAKVQSCIESCKEVSLINNSTRRLKPWMTDYISSQIKKRNYLHKKVKNKPPSDKFRLYYNSFRNKLREKIKSEKSQYYKNKLERNLGNHKATWNVIREITGQNHRVQKFCLNINGSLVTDSGLVANEFNEFFLSVADKIIQDDSLPPGFNNFDYKNSFVNCQEKSSLLLGPVMFEDVVRAVKSLKNGKSPGIDGLSSSLVKRICPNILEVFTYIVDLSFSTGVFPDRLKRAVVVPIHKGKSQDTCSNFRPISLISTFSKVIEKIMKEKLINYLNKVNFFSCNQYGFRVGVNTEMALLDFI
jgi:hypothetical protein